MSRRWPRARWWWGAYALLLFVHHGLELRPEPSPPLLEGQREIRLPVYQGGGADSVRVVYSDHGPPDAPVLLMLHGSPGSMADFRELVPRLRQEFRLVSLDLPGFGRSAHEVPGYSIRAHAHYATQLVERLGLERFSILGFSMGGGVGLHLADRMPERVRSLILLASVGVQEFELLGTYELNHLLHGAQLVAVWMADHLVPHMGLWDASPLDRAYARNFYDTDQRPLRGILEGLEIPVLLIHGRSDPLVPYAAAREHHRIVPQSRLVTVEGSHFLLWTRPEVVADTVSEWMGELESGTLARRADATPERVARAQEPLSREGWVRARGMTLAILLFLLVLGTFLSEDLTSIAAGLLIAEGRLSWAEGLGAVFLGIYFGDQILYFLGRRFGRDVLRRRPWRWLVGPADLRRAARWFERRGLMAILLSRFIPGTRLPTYLAAGVVRAGYWRFALYFFIAVALWTPLLVGFSAKVGAQALSRVEDFRAGSLLLFAAVATTILLFLRVVVPLSTDRGRRILLGRWKRWRYWEFWPAWLIYLPVVVRIAGFALCHRSLGVVTAVNPGIPTGGLVGESKTAILDELGPRAPEVARYRLIPPGSAAEQRAVVDDFLREEGLGLPVVIKPDQGERGAGVVVVRDEERLREVLRGSHRSWMAQEYVGGLEFGIFYVRDENGGRIFSINVKEPLVIEGDGRRGLEDLILHHPRAVVQAETHLRANVDRLEEVPGEGEPVQLVEIGSHARGTIFRDGRDLVTDELTEVVDRLSRRFEGFSFGRYDLRVPSREDLRAGRNLRVIELNGLSSEAAHIYDPRYGVRQAWATLIHQWDLAFRIGAAHRAAGHRPTPVREVLRRWLEHRRGSGDIPPVDRSLEAESP